MIGAARVSTPSVPPQRLAQHDGTAALANLIRTSARKLSQGFYDERQTLAAIDHIFGVDSQLITDGTYYVTEIDGVVAGCGGWSRRATLFGADQFTARNSALLDPAVEAAPIRAFFVHPDHPRRGLARQLLAACEVAALKAGFTRLALMATLPGIPFYRAVGFVDGEQIEHRVSGVTVPFLHMTKELHGAPSRGERQSQAGGTTREMMT